MTTQSPVTTPWLYERYAYVQDGVWCVGWRLRPEHRR